MSDPNPAKVTAHIELLETPYRETVQAIRQLLLGCDERIAEHIKWNSPSFYYSGQMKEFDAKQYKRDLAVVNLHRGKILIVFPTGNTMDAGILPGKDYPDGRKIVEIRDLKDLADKRASLERGVANWLAQIET